MSYFNDSQDFDPHDELFSSIMHPEVSGRAWDKRSERLSRNPSVVKARAHSLPTGRMPHEKPPDPDWLSSTMIEPATADKIYRHVDFGDPIASVFDPDNSFLDDSLARTERAKRAMSLYKKQVSADYRAYSSDREVAGSHHVKDAVRQLREEYDMRMTFGPGPSHRSVHYFNPLPEELYTERSLDKAGHFGTGNLSRITASLPEPSTEDAWMLGSVPDMSLSTKPSSRRPRRERVDSWDTSIEMDDESDLQQSKETLLQRFDRLVTKQLSDKKKRSFEVSSNLTPQMDTLTGHDPSMELSHRSMDAVDIQRSLRSDFTDELSTAVDNLAKIQALERFKGAVRAADDAAKRAPPEQAEAAALSAAQNFEAQLVDIIGAEDASPIVANKLIEVVGYIGTTAPKVPVRTL